MTDPKPTRPRVVMAHSYTTEHDTDRPNDVAAFAHVVEDGVYYSLAIPLPLWEAMGRPDRIAVSVEPSDENMDWEEFQRRNPETLG